MRAELFHDCRQELAEGPVWFQGKLWWVNISAGALNCFDASTGRHESRSIGQMLGAAVPATNGRWLLASQNGFGWLDFVTGRYETITHPEAHQPSNRFNDGKCDPAGRFFAGTMSLENKSNKAALYRVDRKFSVSKVLDGITLSNGLAWSADGGTFYHLDTPTRVLKAYDFDIDRGTLSRGRGVFRFADDAGYPDGMTIDTADRLWIAMWAGGAVACVDPAAGKIVEKVELPVRQVTSCAFGGEKLDELFITTAAEGLEDDQRREQPLAGSIFRAKVGANGSAVSQFRVR